MKKIKNTVFSYIDSGKGTPEILLIPCAGGDHRLFEPQMRGLQDTCHVLSIDLPDTISTNITSIAEYGNLLSQFCNRVGVRPILVGLGFGCRLAIDAVVSHPEQFQGLVLIDPAFFTDNYTDQIRQFIEAAKSPQFSESLEVYLESMYSGKDQEGRKLIKNMFIDNSSLLIRDLELVLAEDKLVLPLLEQIDLPTLFICPKNGGHFPSEYYPHIAPVNKHFRLSTVSNCGFWATLELPDEINRLIKHFHEQIATI